MSELLAPLDSQSLLSEENKVLVFPELTGNYSVARQDYSWIDPSRPEFYNLTQTNRQVLASIYFPAGPKKSGHAPYKKPDDFYFDSDVETNAIVENIQTAEGDFPVIIFSHGFHTPLSLYTYLCENIASYGFVVVGVEHTYISSLTPEGIKLPEIKLPQREHQTLDICCADIKFILSKLAELNSIDNVFKHRLILNEICMFGHSLGGLNTIKACHEIQEVISGIVLDAPLAPLNDISIIKTVKSHNKPMFFLQSDIYIQEQINDNELTKEHLSWCKKNLGNRMQFLPAVTHDDFCDGSIFNSFDEPTGKFNGIAFNIALSKHIAKFFTAVLSRVAIERPLSREFEFFMPAQLPEELETILEKGISENCAAVIEKFNAEAKIIFGILFIGKDAIASIGGWLYGSTFVVSDIAFKQSNFNEAKTLLHHLVFALNDGVQTVYITGVQKKHFDIHDWINEIGVQIINEDEYSGEIISLVINIVEFKTHFNTALLSPNIKLNLSSNKGEAKNWPSVNSKEPDEPIKTSVFIKDATNNVVLGGVVGTIDKSTHHLEVDLLWIHKSIRGQKISEKLMQRIEEQAKYHGCKTAGTCTGTFEAPFLYPKLGYKKVSSNQFIGMEKGFDFKKKIR